MSGFLSLWAIVDKEEIAAINAAVLPSTRFCGAAVPAWMMSGKRLGQPWILPLVFICSKPGRGRTACSAFMYIQRNVNRGELRGANQPDIYSKIVQIIKQNRELPVPNPTNNYGLSLNVLLRNLDDVTKGRGPLIPLARSTGGVLASKEA